jgi:type VI secretion system protein ImpL
MDLAKLQFDFYAKDLANGNPYSTPVDTDARDRTRLYLSGFTGIERAYRALLADAAKGHPGVTFNQKFPGSDQAVTSGVEVAWAFTRDGWKYVQDALKKQNFGGEQWVLGPAQAQSLDPATLEKGILDRYAADYVDTWRNVLKKSNVNRYANFADASKKLTLLTGSGAPLLALFWWTSQNTAVDVPGVSDKFRAVQVVSPYSTVQQYVLPPNQNYNQGLMTLQQAVDRAANKEPNSDQGVRDNALSATNSTRQLSSTFPPDPEAQIDRRSEDLLLQPIKNLDNLGSQDLSSGGSGLCTSFNSKLKNQFPFNPTAKSDVSLDDLGNILRPKTGLLWTVYESTLKNAMDCTADGNCTPKPNSKINPNFVASIGQLMRFSRSLYGDAGTDPNLQYTLKPQASDLVQEFTVTINGQPVALKGGAQHTFQWPGAGQRSFRLALKIGGTSFDVEPFDGPWSVFRFFADANVARASGASYTFDWTATSGLAAQPMKVNNRPVTYEFVTDTGVFSKDFLSKLNCALPVTR